MADWLSRTDTWMQNRAMWQQVQDAYGQRGGGTLLDPVTFLPQALRYGIQTSLVALKNNFLQTDADGTPKDYTTMDPADWHWTEATWNLAMGNGASAEPGACFRRQPSGGYGYTDSDTLDWYMMEDIRKAFKLMRVQLATWVISPLDPAISTGHYAGGTSPIQTTRAAAIAMAHAAYTGSGSAVYGNYFCTSIVQPSWTALFERVGGVKPQASGDIYAHVSATIDWLCKGRAPLVDSPMTNAFDAGGVTIANGTWKKWATQSVANLYDSLVSGYLLCDTPFGGTAIPNDPSGDNVKTGWELDGVQYAIIKPDFDLK